MSDAPTSRFTSRVADYVRYRPGYPKGLFDLLEKECGLGPRARVADVGAGTGIFSALLLESGAEVFAVEPNEAMRAEAESTLGGRAGFHGVAATAEATGLPEGSVDLVTAAQAFHWFDRAAVRREFWRILRTGGRVALVWNERSETANAFLAGYETMLRRFSEDYLRVRHNAISAEDFQSWFGGTMRSASFANGQRFAWDGVYGRLMSSSYAPAPGDPRHEPMIAELRRLFKETAEGGTVEFVYDTNVYYGPLN